MKNKRDVEKELANGEAMIWDSESSQPREEFLDFAINGLAPLYQYDYIIIAVKRDNDITYQDEPDALAACRGKTELVEVFIKFSEHGYMCKVERLNIEVIDLIRNVTHN